MDGTVTKPLPVRWATISQNGHVRNSPPFLNKSGIAGKKHTDLVPRPVQTVD